MKRKREYICGSQRRNTLRTEHNNQKYKDGVHTSVWSCYVAVSGSTPSPFVSTSKNSD